MKHIYSIKFDKDIRTLFCIILLFSTLLYSGRAIYLIFIMGAFVFCITYKKLGRDDLIYMMLLLVVAMIHIFAFSYKEYEISRIINILIIYIPFILFVLRKGIMPSFDTFFYIICALNVVLNAEYIIQYVTTGYSRDIISLLGASINYFASLNCLILCFMLYCYSKKGKRSSLLYAMIALSVFAIFTSLSRVCIIVIALFGLFYACFNLFRSDTPHKFKTFLKYISLGIILGLFVVGIYIFLYNRSLVFRQAIKSFEYYFERIQTIGVGDSRKVLWKNAISIIKKNIWLGSGSSQVLNISSQMIAAHNFILEIILLVGVFGAGIYVLVFLHILKKSMKEMKIEQKFFIWMLSFIYWGIAVFQPFISTAYFYNTLFGFIIIAILKDAQEKGEVNV